MRFVARIKIYIRKEKLESDYYATFKIKAESCCRKTDNRFEELNRSLQFGDKLFIQFILYNKQHSKQSFIVLFI